jgi:hypothetical protein
MICKGNIKVKYNKAVSRIAPILDSLFISTYSLKLKLWAKTT